MNTERTPAFLMANLGSEIQRLYASTDLDHQEESCLRAFRIIEALKEHPQLQKRTGELEILGNILNDKKSPHPRLKVTSEDLQAYFMPFALRALG